MKHHFYKNIIQVLQAEMEPNTLHARLIEYVNVAGQSSLFVILQIRLGFILVADASHS
jgi:hypothetical protein